MSDVIASSSHSVRVEPRDAFRRGAMLLEVLITLGLLLFGMAMIGMQVNMGLTTAEQADIATRAVMLTDTKMAELSAGVLRPELNQEEMKGDFGVLYPGYSWRMRFEPTDMPKFLMVTLEIGYNPAVVADQLANPQNDIEFEHRDNKVIQTAYRLMPVPADVNLERDFGLTSEEIEKALGAPGTGAGGAAGELAEANQNAPGAGAPGSGQLPGGGPLGALPGGSDLAGLAGLLGPLLQSGAFDPRMLTELPPEQYQQIAPFLEMILGRGGVGSADFQQILQRAQERMGGGGGGIFAARGGRRGGGRGGDRDGARGGDRDGARGGDRNGDESGGRDEGGRPGERNGQDEADRGGRAGGRGTQGDVRDGRTGGGSGSRSRR